MTATTHEFDGTQDQPVYRTTAEAVSGGEDEFYSVCALCGEPADPMVSAAIMKVNGELRRIPVHLRCLAGELYQIGG